MSKHVEFESVAEFMARGGVPTIAAPAKAFGAQKGQTIKRAKSTRRAK